MSPAAAAQIILDDPWTDMSRFDFTADSERYNHNVFRFPAKFHPPVARALIEAYSKPGDRILDPFCGSGTIPVEGLLAGRSVVGTDIDPLAIFVSQAKTAAYDLPALKAATDQLIVQLEKLRSKDETAHGDFTKDIDDETYRRLIRPLQAYVPAIPRLDHWFRKRVTVQLARLAAEIKKLSDDVDVRLFLSLCFGSVIRNASNADPVPVSGLEVTKHMREKEAAGRIVDPYGDGQITGTGAVADQRDRLPLPLPASERSRGSGRPGGLC